MQKTTLLLLAMLGSLGFAQQKSTGVMTLNNANVPVNANFTLNNTTSQVTLVLNGPADRWFGVGIGVEEGFGMAFGDCIVYSANTTPNLTDRNFGGTFQPPIETTQNWTTVSNVVSGNVRTLTLTRALVTGDSNDFPMPYATTNSISIGAVRPNSANNNVGGHGGSGSAGFATATFQDLNTDDINLNTVQVFPNPARNFFNVTSRSAFKNVSIYEQSGKLVRTLTFENGTTDQSIDVDGLSSGIYLIEIAGESGKAWKKIVIE